MYKHVQAYQIQYRNVCFYLVYLRYALLFKVERLHLLIADMRSKKSILMKTEY